MFTPRAYHRSLRTRSEIVHMFANYPGVDAYPVPTDEQIDRIRAVQIAGARHGKAGYYPDGDFSSDADWCYGVGAEIDALETELEVDDASIMDLYMSAHEAFFRDGTINPSERHDCPDIYDMWFGACGLTEISVHARSFDDALERAAEHVRDVLKLDIVFLSQEQELEALTEACAERGFTPADIDWSDLHGAHADAVEAAEADTTYTESGRIMSDEWGGSGPR